MKSDMDNNDWSAGADAHDHDRHSIAWNPPEDALIAAIIPSACRVCDCPRYVQRRPPSAGTNMPANAVITLTLMESVRISRDKPPMAFPCRFRARCRERHICGIRNIDWAIYRPTQPVSCFDRHISNRESSTSNEMEWTGDC